MNEEEYLSAKDQTITVGKNLVTFQVFSVEMNAISSWMWDLRLSFG